MKKASEYRRHASECRALAAKMDSGEHRDQLLDMAATWERLADERERFVRAAAGVSANGAAATAR